MHAGSEGDIEDLCTICEPIPSWSDSGVMKYRTKCSRKGVRDELDTVNVIEWAAQHFLVFLTGT